MERTREESAAQQKGTKSMDDKNLTPSLTLEDTPAAPSLTLDPFAEEEKAKAPDPVEETPLTPEEQKMVDL